MSRYLVIPWCPAKAIVSNPRPPRRNGNDCLCCRFPVASALLLTEWVFCRSLSREPRSFTVNFQVIHIENCFHPTATDGLSQKPAFSRNFKRELSEQIELLAVSGTHTKIPLNLKFISEDRIESN